MRVLAIAGLGLTIAACATTPLADASGTYYVREGMVNGINPPITAIWDMQVEVMDDYGNFDPDLMDADKWASVKSHAAQLQIQAERMASAERYVAADPAGALTDPPEGTDLVAIQARLDASAQAYRAMSISFRNHADQLLAATQQQDAEKVTMLVNDMQPVCKACHDVFWYPEEYQGAQ